MPGGCEYVVLRIRQLRERWLADHAAQDGALQGE
jgi:hypothetical protein